MKLNRMLQIVLLTSAIYLILLSVRISLVSFNQDYENCKKEHSTSICVKYFLLYLGHESINSCFINKIEDKGIPNSTAIINLNVDAYAQNLTKGDAKNLINNVNKIWNEYTINFSIREFGVIENNNQTISAYNCTELKLFSETVVNQSLYNDSVPDIILTKFKEKDIGRGLKSFSPCDNTSIELVVVSTSSQNLTWNLAHELGHIVGLEDKAFYSGETNLMTHMGCIKEKYFPTLLNQVQVDIITSSVNSQRLSNLH